MQMVYNQQQPKIGYDFSEAKFSAFARGFDLADINEDTEWSLEQIRNYHISYKKNHNYYEEKKDSKNLITSPAESAAHRRDKALESQAQNKKNAWISGLITGVGYAMTLGAEIIHHINPSSMLGEFLVTPIIASASANKITYKNSNIFFAKTRAFIKDAKRDAQGAKDLDFVVFALNGGDISQCIYPEETLTRAEQFKRKPEENKM